MHADRATVIHVIKTLSDELGRQYAGEPPIEHMDDQGMRRAALLLACEVSRISVEDYEAALRADPSLAELERESTTYAVVDAPDPGPYDAISRESPSGQPGDLTKPRSLPRKLAPGGS
jgi:hypothetical protein